MDNQRKPRPSEEVNQIVIENGNKIEVMMRTEGWAVLEADIKETLSESYGRMANGDREHFDEAKGYLRGLQYALNAVKSYIEKRNSFLRN